MRFSAFLPLIALLAACDTPAVTGSDPETVCTRRADDHPDVQHLKMRRLANPNFGATGDDETKWLIDQIKRDCLRRMGAAQTGPGGVETVRNPQGYASSPLSKSFLAGMVRRMCDPAHSGSQGFLDYIISDTFISLGKRLTRTYGPSEDELACRAQMYELFQITRD